MLGDHHLFLLARPLFCAHRMLTFGMLGETQVGGLGGWVEVAIAEAKGPGWMLRLRCCWDFVAGPIRRLEDLLQQLGRPG